RASPHILFFVAFGLRRIDGHSYFFPPIPVRAMELYPEMPVVECCVVPAVARIRQRQRDVIAEEIDGSDLPATAVARCREQAFAARHEELVAHSLNLLTGLETRRRCWFRRPHRRGARGR